MGYYIGIWCTHPLLCICRFVGDMVENEEPTYDILGEALQKKPNGSRVQGLGQFITPSMYFNIPDPKELAREWRMYQESFQFMQAQLD